MATFGAFEFSAPIVAQGGYSFAQAFEFSGAVPVQAGTPPQVVAINTAVRRHEAVQLRVTDAEGLRRVVLLAVQPAGLELVHDGSSWGPHYAGTVETVTGAAGPTQQEYTVRRLAGWQAAPRFRVLAIDASGQEA